MATSFGSSVLTGYDFTRIKALTDQYYIPFPASPSTGDLLQWNGTIWTNVPLIKQFSAYDHAGAITIGTSAVDLTYDTEIKKDTEYTHAVGVAGITVITGGYYFVQADLSLNVSAGTTVSYVSAWLAKNGTEIQGTRASIYTPTSGARGSGAIGRIVSLAANDVIKVQAQLSGAGNTVATVADSSRITLIRVAAASGGSGNTGIPMGLLLALTYA